MQVLQQVTRQVAGVRVREHEAGHPSGGADLERIAEERREARQGYIWPRASGSGRRSPETGVPAERAVAAQAADLVEEDLTALDGLGIRPRVGDSAVGGEEVREGLHGLVPAPIQAASRSDPAWSSRASRVRRGEEGTEEFRPHAGADRVEDRRLLVKDE